MRKRWLISAALLLAALCGCHGDSSEQTGLQFVGAGGTLALKPSTLSFTNVGAAYAQSVSIGTSGYSVSSGCGAIASITISKASFTVTPLSAGTCAVIVSANGEAGIVNVSVTTTTVGGS
jgi:hypothetical protein